MLTADEMERVVAACAAPAARRCSTLSVIGRVELDPADPLDAEVAEAFNAHQRRTVDGRTLLGPDAVDAAVDGVRPPRRRVRGAAQPVAARPGPGRPGRRVVPGWLGAACEQRPELTGPAAEYAARRCAQAAAGRLGVVVHHEDLLAEPLNRADLRVTRTWQADARWETR